MLENEGSIQERTSVIACICREISKTTQEKDDLIRHGEGSLLVGIWSNQLVRKVNLKIERMGVSSKKAQLLSEDMRIIHMRHSMIVQNRWSVIVKPWKQGLSEDEVNLIQEVRSGDREASELPKNMQLLWTEDWTGSSVKQTAPTWAEKAAAEIEAKERKITVGQVLEEARILVGQARSMWIRKVNHMQTVQEQPGVYAQRIMLFRGNLKKQWELWLIEHEDDWAGLIDHIEEMEIAKGDLYGGVIGAALQGGTYAYTSVPQAHRLSGRVKGQRCTGIVRKREEGKKANQEKKRKKESAGPTAPLPSGRPDSSDSPPV